MEEATQPTTCNRCGESFNTSAQNPRRYCSIACEEGWSALPQSDPESDGYHLHLQGEPQSLVGKVLVGTGLRRTDYSPDWHKSPDQYNSRDTVSIDRENTILIYQTDIIIGQVVDYNKDTGTYTVEKEYDTKERQYTANKKIDTTVVVSEIRQDNWWVT